MLSRTLAFNLITNDGYHSLAGKFLLVVHPKTELSATYSGAAENKQAYATLKSVSVNLGHDKSLATSDFLEIAVDITDKTISS